MPDEPNSHIEELLKSYARKRREDAGAPLEMHPATRKLLQDEAAKLRPEPTPASESFSSLLARLMPKILIVGSLGVVVLAAVVLLKPGAREPQQQLAKNDEARDAATAPQRTAALEAKTGDRVTPANEPMFRAEEAREQAKPEPLPTKLGLATGAAPADGPQTPPASAALAFDDKQEAPSLDESTVTKSLASERLAKGPGAAKIEAPPLKMQEDKLPAPSASPAPAAPLPSEEQVHAGQFANVAGSVAAASSSSSMRQQFSRVNAAIAGKDARADSVARSIDNVLANFQIEQTGNRVRIVDADGSTYEGNVALAAEGGRMAVARKAASSTEKKREAGAGGQLLSEMESGQSVSFRVTGTNRSLNQVVVFEGNLVPDTNAPTQTAVRSRLGGEKQKVSGESSFFNSRIQGRARVGAGKEIEIDAVPSQ